MRECAYVRVSTELLEQDSSYINQEQMYLDKGIKHIYKDKESGTSINRQGFISMLEDCGLQVKAIKTSIKDKLVVLPTDRPSKINRDTYIKDYLISIKVHDCTLTYKDLSIKYANEVKALYEEIN